MKRDYWRQNWVILDRYGDPLPKTVRGTRQGAISAFMDEWPLVQETWKQRYDAGFRCQKVTLVDGWKEVDDE